MLSGSEIQELAQALADADAIECGDTGWVAFIPVWNFYLGEAEALSERIGDAASREIIAHGSTPSRNRELRQSS